MDLLGAMAGFMAAIETGSFSSAARWLGFGQPPVSKSIANLERQVGVSLLSRTTHVMPTEAGQRYCKRAPAARRRRGSRAGRARRRRWPCRRTLRVGGRARSRARNWCRRSSRFSTPIPISSSNCCSTTATPTSPPSVSTSRCGLATARPPAATARWPARARSARARDARSARTPVSRAPGFRTGRRISSVIRWSCMTGAPAALSGNSAATIPSWPSRPRRGCACARPRACARRARRARTRDRLRLAVCRRAARRARRHHARRLAAAARRAVGDVPAGRLATSLARAFVAFVAFVEAMLGVAAARRDLA
ncbi:transcriptional regulator, LysR family [Burkholderia plantarii]|uniref:Transcriptional regulator, LysR family n=1 Tax=Burkholderia plantarii TaxID=41899 RepID=A0A0B6RPE8_BURPL|nr:transcriptional regulator, LysR family [Burkholderia plantarii]